MSAQRGKRTRLTDHDLALLIRDHTAAEIADAHGIREDRVRSRLSRLGLDCHGEPLAPPAPAPRARVVDFDRSRDESWRDRSECRVGGHHPDTWFPEDRHNSRAQAAAIAAAKSVCAACPVLAQCLDAVQKAERGRSIDHRFGIVAGMTPRERVALERGEVA